jgi:L-asparaginase
MPYKFLKNTCMSEQSRILMLYTGGTIGMVKAVDSDSLIPFDFEHLLEQIPDIARLECTLDTDSLDKPIDSSNIKPEHWLRLARRIEQDYDNYDGFVILHGSDTMAYTASALSFLLYDCKKPVILTGSQLPIGMPRSDARENLLTTLEIAMARKADGSPVISEVCIYFEYDLFRGNRTHKVSAEDFDAFESLNYPKLAEAGVHIKYNTPALLNGKARDSQRFKKVLSTEISVLTVFPGMTPAYVSSVLAQDVKAILLRSFGSGNAPTDPWFISALREAIAHGKLLINVSQCNGGGVQLGKYEASKEMLDMGVISARDMTFEAALTKGMFLLAQGLDAAAFKNTYEQDVVGELSEN